MNQIAPDKVGSLVKANFTALDILLPQDLSKTEFSLKGNLRAISIVSEDIVWVSGASENVYRTEDGGGTWQAWPTGESADFRCCHAFNQAEACIASSGHSEDGKAFVSRTENGGVSWKRVLTITTPHYFISGMRFWDSKHGIILCDPVDGLFQIFLTEDGGCTWKQQESNHQLQAFPREVVFAASNTCMALQGDNEIWFATGGAEIARVFHSHNRGYQWEVYETPFKCHSKLSGLFSISFHNSLEGIAVGGDYENPGASSQANIIITQDGGKTWDPLTNPRVGKLCLFCAAWVDQRPIVVEGSSKTFHTVAISKNKIWMAGPDKAAFVHR